MFLKESHLIEIEKKEGKSAKDLQHVNCHHISHSGENIIRPFKCFSLQYKGLCRLVFIDYCESHSTPAHSHRAVHMVPAHYEFVPG